MRSKTSVLEGFEPDIHTFFMVLAAWRTPKVSLMNIMQLSFGIQCQFMIWSGVSKIPKSKKETILPVELRIIDRYVCATRLLNYANLLI